MADKTLPPMAQPRVAAGALFFDDIGRVLLVKPTYKERWDIPGGYVEPGETPRQACQREIREELGLTVEVGNLLVVDWAPMPSEGDKLLFVFDGGATWPEIRSQVTLASEELSEFRFFRDSELPNALTDRLLRRVRASVQAAANRDTRYLEHGA